MMMEMEMVMEMVMITCGSLHGSNVHGEAKWKTPLLLPMALANESKSRRSIWNSSKFSSAPSRLIKCLVSLSFSANKSQHVSKHGEKMEICVISV